LAESFLSAIKGELPDDQAWPTRATARSAITEYIAWYNGTRLHSALGYQPPAEYEATRQHCRKTAPPKTPAPPPAPKENKCSRA
jgi:hypothetical protein